jgi:hypothetical protein
MTEGYVIRKTAIKQKNDMLPVIGTEEERCPIISVETGLRCCHSSTPKL